LVARHDEQHANVDPRRPVLGDRDRPGKLPVLLGIVYARGGFDRRKLEFVEATTDLHQGIDEVSSSGRASEPAGREPTSSNC
jgi:hypothetical protein